MAATKATAKAATKRGATKRPPVAVAPRKRSKLSQAGDAAKLKTERDMLLKTLRAEGWGLSATARALALTDASSVLRAIVRYDLTAEYEKHKP